MTLNIKLYGYIPNPIYDEVFYILKEKQISPSIFQYEGKVGYGFYDSAPPSDAEFPVQYIPSDMRELKFRYDAEKNLVILDTYWRYENCEEEFKAIRNNVSTEDTNTDESDGYYPYLRFPRSKDGISVSRLFDFIFADKKVRVIVQKTHIG